MSVRKKKNLTEELKNSEQANVNINKSYYFHVKKICKISSNPDVISFAH